VALPTPEEFAEKWKRRLKGSVEDIRRGVEKVTESPGAKAAQKFDKWVAKITSDEVQNKWKERVAKVDVNEWKTMTLQKGIPAISRGVDLAEDKMRDFGAQLLEHIAAGLRKLEGMPDVTFEDSKARVIAWMEHMKQFKRR